MTLRKISISIRGIKPAPWGNNEWSWRNVLATESRKQHQEAISSGAKFEVAVIFYLIQSTLDKSDLDNLAKPVLDTLFLPNNPQVKDKTLTGALIEMDDSCVVKLSLEKQRAPSAQEEGAEIVIAWEE
jgi:Holliday junction resolvase RusA-like endonuclease